MQSPLLGLSVNQISKRSVLYQVINESSCLSFILSPLAFLSLDILINNNYAVAASTLALILLNNSNQKKKAKAENILQRWCKNQQNNSKQKNVQICLNVLWLNWYESRSPILRNMLEEHNLVASEPVIIKCMSSLIIGQSNRVKQNTPPSLISGYIAILEDIDVELREKATDLLSGLKKQESIDTFCQAWNNQERYSSLIEDIIIKAGYVASFPQELHILTYLLNYKTKPADKLFNEEICLVIDGLNHPNERISRAAADVLSNLDDPSLQDSLCKVYLAKPNDLLESILIKTGYSPISLENKVLLFFLTGQWKQYDSIDFDQRILKSLYPVLSKEQRTQITKKIQSSGKTEYSSILIYWNDPYSQRPVTLSESEMLVKILAEKKDFVNLWSQMVGLYPETCLLAMHILLENDWKPDNPTDLKLFRELSDISGKPICLSSNTLDKLIPLAIPLARINVKGRINDICFNPQKSIIAIGTGIKKIVLWDFSTAASMSILDGFDHSISKLTYLRDQTLIIGERTNRHEPCAVYAWKDNQSHKLGYHLGGVTSLLPVGSDRFISCGKDSEIVLWDMNSTLPISRITAPIWARSACFANDQTTLLIFDESAYRVNLKTKKVQHLQKTNKEPNISKSVVRSSTFSTSMKHFLTGTNLGQIFLYEYEDTSKIIPQSLVRDYEDTVQEIQYIPDSDIMVASLVTGKLDFLKEPSYTSIGVVNHPEGKLTSCYISSSGKFMATGTSEYSMILWDLQVRKLNELFHSPLSMAKPDVLGELKILIESNILPIEIKNGLEFTHRLLQHRFIYDVEISDVSFIQPGEFDIIVN